MSARVLRFRTLSQFLLVAIAFAGARAQTYKVDPGATDRSQTHASPAQGSKEPLGWGSNIENARLAHAAEAALKNGQYGAAVDYAQRAAQSAPGDSNLWFLLGYAARLAGRPQLSIDAYEHGLSLKPSSHDGLSGLAQTYMAIGRRDDAERYLNRALSTNPNDPVNLMLLGDLLLQSGEYEKALAPLHRAEQAQPAARPELLLALCYQRLKQFDNAGRYLEMAKRKSPDNPEVLRSLAGYYRETGNYPAAIHALRTIRSPSPDVEAELAYTFQLQGNEAEAAKLYAQAADASPKSANLQLSAAQALLAEGKMDSAERFLKRAQSLDPEQYSLHAIRGQIARLQERDRDAVAEYSAAIEHLPSAPPEGPVYGVQLHIYLIELYKRLHDDANERAQLDIARKQINTLEINGRGRDELLKARALVKFYDGDSEGALKDVNEALSLNAHDANGLQLDGDLLVKLGRPEEAMDVFKKILAIEPNNRFALLSLGSVSRELGRDQEAEKYFQRSAAVYPNSSAPYLALGDLYTSRRDFARAQAAYRKGNELAPDNALMVAHGMNAAIEAHTFALAGEWRKRASTAMQADPQLMLQNERYLTWTGKYEESAAMGREVVKKLPSDRDAIVYLGYDLLHLERYDELLKLTSDYDDVLPKEPDLPLLAGYVHKHAGQFEDAEKDFTRTLDRDSKVPTAYVNRGYVRHDLHKPEQAAEDFDAALRLEPDNGEAHLGLAYANLDLHRPQAAVRQTLLAEKELGDSMPLHLIRATAYGEQGSLTKAVKEYRVALRSSPNDPALHLALGNTLYDQRHFHDAIGELELADKLSPGHGETDAQLARAYAQLGDRDKTMAAVVKAEKEGPSTVLVSTGEALSLLGEHNPAMERFEKALTAPDGDRVGVRLAIASLMVKEGEIEDARRQIALALMEAQAGQTAPATGNQLSQAADLFLATHDFQLAEQYFQRALAAGAPESSVRVGLANTYLALGDTPRADAQLSALDHSQGVEEPSYDYLMAKASLYRQEHLNTRVLTAFAQASNAAGEDEAAERELLQAGGDEGLRLNNRVSFLSDFSVAPIFEDTTTYALDAKLDTILPGRQGLLPPPRSSLQTQWTGAYHLHVTGVPDAGGFFQVRNSRGAISVPSANSIVNRDTTDYSFNFEVNPRFRLGDNTFSFRTGLQETVRRDSQDPVDMNQNLFRQFVYMSTSSFFNWVSVNGYAIREAGPFIETRLRSRDLSGALEFRVGRPWEKTALITGWGSRDVQFFPVTREFYLTSTYLGVERRFSERFQLRAIGEYVRAWRVELSRYAIAQAFRPTVSLDFSPARHWTVNAQFAYARNMGIHDYDAVQSGFAVSYALPFRRAFKENGTSLPLQYPIRFGAGMQQENFFNFAGTGGTQFRPYVSITIF